MSYWLRNMVVVAAAAARRLAARVLARLARGWRGGGAAAGAAGAREFAVGLLLGDGESGARLRWMLALGRLSRG